MSFRELVERRIGDVERELGGRLPVTWDVGQYPTFDTLRGHGVTLQEPPSMACHMRFAPKLERAPEHRQDGIVRHELGHVVDLCTNSRALDTWARARGVQLPKQSQAELRADAVAKAIWGTPLRYDKDTVQSTKVGALRRPVHLGY